MAVVVAQARAAPKDIFGQCVSDHVPQEYSIRHPKLGVEAVKIFNWNVMARALCRRKSPAAPGGDSEISNNGLDMDETIAEYTRRLQEKVAPVLVAWLREQSRSPRQKWVICLQEAPGHPHIRRDLLLRVEAGVRAVRAATLQSSELQLSAFARTVTLWDAAQWELKFCAHAGDHVLCTVLGGKETPFRFMVRTTEVQHEIKRLFGVKDAISLRVLNCHLPLLEGGSQPAAERVLGLLRGSPAEQVALVVGDIKADLSDEGVQKLVLGVPAASDEASATALGVVAGSCLHDWTRVSSDGAVLGQGEAATEQLLGVPTGSVLGRWDPLQGHSRQDFISEFVNYNLQDAVLSQSADLSDEELGSIGAHHFGDQAEQLEHLRALRVQSRGYKAASATPLEREESPPKSMPISPLIPMKRFIDEAARQEFLRQHIHRKLHREAATLTDEALQLLGSLHFSEQPAQLPGLLRGSPAAPAHNLARGDNEASVRRRLGRSLGSRTAATGDDPRGELEDGGDLPHEESWAFPPEAATVEWAQEVPLRLQFL
eukprot:s3402_g4.t1